MRVWVGYAGFQWQPGGCPQAHSMGYHVPQMASRLSKRCSGTHKHEPLLGGRAEAASFYSLDLITEILRGIRDTEDAAAEQPDATTCGVVPGQLSQHVSLFHDVDPGIAFAVAEEEILHKNKGRTTTVKHSDGSTQTIDPER